MAVTAIVAAVAGCGHRAAAPAATARDDATSACADLLSMGKAIGGGETVLSKTALTVLDTAHLEADRAEALDRRWESLAGTIRVVGVDLLSGRRGDLAPSLDDLAVECEPLVEATATTAG